MSTACLAAAIAIRVAVMPVYGWLPDAHALAPHAVSAILSGVLIKTPLFALGRLLAHLPLGADTMRLVGSAGVVTALAAVVVALSQKDAKRLLAYHSISQIGYIVAAWGIGTPAALTAAYLHALYHAMFKGVLFLSVGTITDAAGSRNVYELRGAASALRRAGDGRLVVAAAYATGALAIMALPPLNGFASKNAITYLFKGGWEYWALFAAGACTVASFLKLSMIFLPERRRAEPEGASAEGDGVRIGAAMKTSMLMLAALCVATGLFADAVAAGVGRLLGYTRAGASAYTAANLLKALQTAAIGAVVFAAAVSKPGKRVAAAIRSRPRSFSGLVTAFLAGLAALGAMLASL